MKLADYVIAYLADMGIDTAFLVQGAANNDLIYAIADNPKMKYVCTQHEQAAGFAAEGWAKVKGVPGLAIATSGPGGQNLITCAANCYFDSVPCIFITGQINSKFLRPNNRIRQVGFQESPMVDLFRPVVKHSVQVRDPNQIKFVLQYATWIAQEGNPGPVHIDIPLDVQAKDIDPTSSAMPRFRPEPPDWNLFRVREQIGRFLNDLAYAKRPVMIVGGGARGSKVREIASYLGIPAFPTWNAIDIITDDFHMFGGRIGTYGGKGRNIAIQKADLLLSIGSRISGRITGGEPSTFMPHAKKYMVDVDTGMMDPETMQVKFDELIRCDAKVFCEEIDASCGHILNFRTWREEVASLRDRFDPVRPEHFKAEHVHPYAFFRTLSQEMGPDDILVGDCGGNVVCLNHAFETKYGQLVFSNHGNSPMGFAMCGAMGAWFASGGKGNVVCTIGDGGFQLNIQELQTLRHYNIPIKVFIINNEQYGITKAFQIAKKDGRTLACGPDGYSVPCFHGIVHAYGLQCVPIVKDEIKSLSELVRCVLRRSDSAIADVYCPGFHDYYPKTDGWDTPIHDMTPRLDREEFAKLME